MIQEEVTMTAFPSMEFIMEMETNEEKYHAWIQDYKGLYYSIGENGKDLIYWEREKEKYILSDETIDGPTLCYDGKYRMPNKIQRKKDRLVIEFDDEDISKIPGHIKKVKERLESMNTGYIESSHKGKSNYIWVEFNRELTTEEAKSFLKWVSPPRSRVDLNFTSDNKRFPCLFAPHWKYGTVESVVEFHPGSQIDYDSLSINKKNSKSKAQISNDGYVTSIKEEVKTINAIKLNQFLSVHDKKEHPIIKNFLPEKSIVAVFGEPGSLKSFLGSYVGLVASSGKKFLGSFKTRKCNVMILSAENPERIDRKRLKAICKGLRINPRRRKFENLRLEYVGRKDIGLLNYEPYYESLKEKIRESRIKLLVIDTLSCMISDLDDNRANEIVQVFNERLFPLVDEFGLSILFLLHSQKTGKDFLGSIKLKASVDIFYEAKRDENDHNKLSVLCHKAREGEYNFDLDVRIESDEKDGLRKVEFILTKSYEGKQSVASKGLETKKIDVAKEIILNALRNRGDKEYSYGELISLSNSNVSKITMKRAITILYDDHKIFKQKGKNKGYAIS